MLMLRRTSYLSRFARYQVTWPEKGGLRCPVCKAAAYGRRKLRIHVLTQCVARIWWFELQPPRERPHQREGDPLDGWS
jgi:hypothetical protein